ncbi:MAG: 2,3,4,5-tetrahydropyridine-2,6-dicarboxylate N-succinyltransferase, partial [Jiangellaceae bacterium]
MSESPARSAWGLGLVTTDTSRMILDAWYPSPALGAPLSDDPASHELAQLVGDDEDRGIYQRVTRTVIDLDSPPIDAADAYLRLHLL